MRHFSNIMPNFAAYLHLLVDSIVGKNPPLVEKKSPKYLLCSDEKHIFAVLLQGAIAN